MEMFIGALKDTGSLIPFLGLIYFVIGFLEYRYGDRMNHFIMHVGVMGPVAGALVACSSVRKRVGLEDRYPLHRWMPVEGQGRKDDKAGPGIDVQKAGDDELSLYEGEGVGQPARQIEILSGTLYRLQALHEGLPRKRD